MGAPGARKTSSSHTCTWAPGAVGEGGAEPTEVPRKQEENSHQENKDHSSAPRAFLRCPISVSFHSQFQDPKFTDEETGSQSVGDTHEVTSTHFPTTPTPAVTSDAIPVSSYPNPRGHGSSSHLEIEKEGPALSPQLHPTLLSPQI